MKLWPGSLVGRNALVIVTVMLLAQVGSALLVRNLIIRPRVEQVAEAVARNVAAVRAGLAVLPAEQRNAFIEAFRQRSSDGASTAAEEPSSPLVAALLSPIEQAFVRSVSTRLAAEDTDVVWRRDADRGLALRLRIGDDAYWLPLPGVLPTREMSGAWLAASAIAALLAVGAALAIQHRIDEPLRALVAATARLGMGARPEPLPEDGPAEIASVGRSFNQLVQRLDETDRERALMLAGVSHDLRTPLTKLRLGVEILSDGAEPSLVASMNRSVAEMDRLVGQFLDFARHDDHGAPTEPVALDRVAEEIAASFADHGQRVQLDAAPVPPLALRAESVRRAIANLVENAFRHGAEPVLLRTGHDASCGWIEVADAGPGIPTAEVDAMKQPFRRAGSARSGRAGAGLGLAIAERAARAHAGRLELMAASPHGLRARLVLPFAATP